MKKIARLITILFAVAVAITSCNSNKPTLAKYIPKDAVAVIGLNAKSITEKLATGNLSLDTLAAILTSNEGDSTADSNKWNELKTSGIDLAAPFYAFFKTTSSIMDGSTSTVGVVASIKDVAVFEQYLKKKKPGGDIKTDGDYSYLALGEDFVVGWKDNVAILSQVHGGRNAPGVYATGEGTLSQQLLKKLFGQATSESVLSLDAYKNVEKAGGDMTFFFNASAGQGALSALSLTKASDLIADSYTTGSVNFDNGKVTAVLTGYTGKALGDILEKHPGHAIDVDALNKYPLQADGFVSISFDPQVLVDILKFAGADGMINQTLTQNFNLTLEDVAKAFKGDVGVAFSITDGGEKPVTDLGIPTKPPFVFVFNSAIGDKASYDKVISALAAKGVQLPKEGTVKIPLMGDIAISVTDKNLVLASDATVLQQYLAGSPAKSAIPADVKEKIKGKSFAMYMDVEKLDKISRQRVLSMAGNQGDKDTTAQPVKDFIATADKIDGRVSKGNAELRLFDEKQNSLVVLIRKAIASNKAGHHYYFPGAGRFGRPDNVMDSVAIDSIVAPK